MAKEKEAEGAESQEKKTEEKPPKKPGEMSLMKMLIMVGGTVVVLFILLIVVYMVVIKPDLQKMSVNGEGKTQTEEMKQEKDEDFNPEEIKKEENERFMSTGRITTNPSMSTQFVVVDLGLDFYVNEEQMKEIKKEKPEESPLMLRPLSSVKGEVNNLLGSMTVQELQSIRRDTLQSMINAKLVKVFLANKMVLKEAILQEFIIQ
ncbi:MAG: hypothetical protein A2X61_06435 [Ignavibacteria bacterium GWB2_35_12]|nr:MAG: hypothetical protein A2X61_06435 [Ignavibacteria bacterium GWB2_35_12]OGU95880.1 MAG: hypothetical protein A2220_03540 [Ignavibacteria bacterium RIFOXYA2_FULL_35_10]OGV20648.1 MAG: hypothetical protein A2475_03675 [Ignavibacteria bacterium RIFOXYC2_FULL_35_21]